MFAGRRRLGFEQALLDRLCRKAVEKGELAFCDGGLFHSSASTLSVGVGNQPQRVRRGGGHGIAQGLDVVVGRNSVGIDFAIGADGFPEHFAGPLGDGYAGIAEKGDVVGVDVGDVGRASRREFYSRSASDVGNAKRRHVDDHRTGSLAAAYRIRGVGRERSLRDGAGVLDFDGRIGHGVASSFY